MTVDLEPLTFQRPQKLLREAVQDVLREAIVDLRFVPGQRLVERNLCEQLGVSRTVVREVLRTLEAEGLVEIVPQRGPIIARIKPEDAKQIYEIRALLEGMAVEVFTRIATPDDLELVAQAVAQIHEAVAAKDPRQSLRATNLFYQHVFRVAQKGIAWAMIDSLNLKINTLRAMTVTLGDRQQESVREMEIILAAIRSGDPTVARIAAVEHVEKAAAVAEIVLAQMAEAARPAPLAVVKPEPQAARKRTQNTKKATSL